MRFIMGTTSAAGLGWRPKEAAEVASVGGMGVWAHQFGAGEIRRGSFGDGTVLVAGSCLASVVELERAAAAAARGDWVVAARLPGSALVLVRTGSVWRVLGDRAGTVQVYWMRFADRVLWGTAAAPLASLGGYEADPAVLLGQMMLRGVDVLDGVSHFQGVRRVRPGHALVLEEGQPPRTEPVAPPVAQLAFDKAAPLVRDAVVEAVQRRMLTGGSISADLSGGMDSSVVASVASLSRQLLAVTYTDPRMRDEDDVRYAHRVAAELPGVRHHVVEGGSGAVRHFGGLDDPHLLPITDTPTYSLGLLEMKRLQLAEPVRNGSRLHLTGRGGDDVLDAVGSMPLDQFRAGQRGAAWRRVTALARTRRASGTALLAQAARTIATPYPRALEVLADRVQAARPDGPAGPARILAWCSADGSLPWLTRSGRTLLGDLIGARTNSADRRETPGRLHERLALELMGDGHATFDQMSRTLWGLPVHAPLLDNRVVHLCHAIPGWERTRPGAFKPLARAAFTGVVPDVLLERRTKTSFAGSLYDGLRAHAPAVRRILSGSTLVQAGLLDRSRVLGALDAGVRGETFPMAALHGLVVTELWLALLPLGRSAWWERTGTPRVAA
ncbi:asparagine synthase-related protein [Streptomyces sp. NPDC048567]|uniref:asparagine synthase-related protein n=1 Tax=Streptomyces sp. NPDC048567 TaxID=3365570 RepID=UPI00371A4C73